MGVRRRLGTIQVSIRCGYAGDDAGAFHSSDLWFSFGTLPASWRPFRGWHYDLSHAMNRYWVNFAATGDPNGSGLPEWTACGPDGQRYMLFGGCHDTPGNVSCVMVK
ncbi:carboxylesterase family protein [Bifidobacterium adolescentis]|uniref:carboxylesterase family protein n=1 Tax=Bifidobacterium adolescentis TaxID=1680 RepID=UPI001E4DA0A1|nr:carboxylesterase family protein [Bifidobacterium adolescentis]